MSLLMEAGFVGTRGGILAELGILSSPELTPTAGSSFVKVPCLVSGSGMDLLEDLLEDRELRAEEELEPTL